MGKGTHLHAPQDIFFFSALWFACLRSRTGALPRTEVPQIFSLSSALKPNPENLPGSYLQPRLPEIPDSDIVPDLVQGKWGGCRRLEMAPQRQTAQLLKALSHCQQIEIYCLRERGGEGEEVPYCSRAPYGEGTWYPDERPPPQLLPSRVLGAVLGNSCVAAETEPRCFEGRVKGGWDHISPSSGSAFSPPFIQIQQMWIS